jgi:hypothetical protein
MDPEVIGWPEFWARSWLLLVLLVSLFLAILILGKVFISVHDVISRLRGKSRKESSAPTSREALRGTVYVSEYDGRPSRVHLTPEAAQDACREHLRDEVGGEPTWDWFADPFGWIMRRVHPETGWPGSLLSGRVTKATIEE